MPKITPDHAENIYRRYAATLMNPVPIEELIPNNEISEVNLWTYEHGMIRASDQLQRLYHNQLSSLDPSEPYDIGFVNAIKFAIYVTTGALPEFIEKPADPKIAAGQLQNKIKNLNKKVNKLNQELAKTQSDLNDSIAAKDLVIKTLEDKHADELAKKSGEIKKLIAEAEASKAETSEKKKK